MPDGESLRELLVDLFRRGDALSGFVAEQGWLSALVREETEHEVEVGALYVGRTEVTLG